VAKPIYLDYAAATPVDPAVLKAMQPFWRDDFYNPSATYLAAQKVGKDLQAARARVAACLGARPTEIIFTAGGTESVNLAINGVMQKYSKAKMLVSAIEHDAVLKTAIQFNHAVVPVTGKGVVDVAELVKMVDDQTVLVSVMYVNNEIGTIQPLRQIGQALATIRRERLAKGNKLPLYFHSDASQAPNYLDVHVNSLGVDLLTLNGGKIYGPKQSGLLFVKAGIELAPQVLGGGQENGLRSGTENVAFAVGLATALELVQKQRPTEVKRLQSLQQDFVRGLQKAVTNVQITAEKAPKLPNNVHITIPGVDNERLIMQLDEAGIMAAAGSACSASNDEPSHVLRAIGISEKEAQSSVRFTMGQGTTAADIKLTISTVASLVK
jgi:cysteine desulfurase